MDCGVFYRGGSSITALLSGVQEYMCSLSSTPNNSFNSSVFCPSPAATDSLVHNGSANQKLDQLLFLFNEQKAQNGELHKEVSAMKEQLSELLKKQNVTQESVVNAVRRTKMAKLPSEVSVSSIIVSTLFLASFFNVYIKFMYLFQLTVKRLHNNSHDTLKFNGEEK